MRYKIIKIEQHPGTHDFKSGVFEIGGDRVFSEQEPNPLGHFIIPNESSSLVAFKKLKDCMIMDIEKQIRDLEKCKEAITKLTLEE